jgi:hypothetical protein
MHGHLASGAAKMLGEEWPELAGSCQSWVCLGSVFPDVGFFLPYTPFARAKAEVRRLAGEIHGGAGEDTYKILNAGIASMGEIALPERASFAAFIAGIAAHLQADIYWHPFVYFFSGHYGAEQSAEAHAAQTAHRGIETVMDAELLRTGKLSRPVPTVKSWLQQTDKGTRQRLTLALFRGYGLKHPQGAVQAYEKAWQVMALAQKVFSSRVAGRFLAPILWSAGGSWRAIAAMFDQGPARRGASWVRTPRSFRHPITGASQSFDFEAFRTQSIAQTAGFWRDLLQPALNGSADLPYGPSLAYGMPKVSEKDIRFVSPDPFDPAAKEDLSS